MSAPWTPGPWTIHVNPEYIFSDGEVDKGGYRIDAENIEQLAYVWNDCHRWAYLDEEKTPFGAKEAEANGRLIAAAPDLAEALEECLAQAEQCWVHHYGHLSEDELVGVPEHIAKARVALAKAKGVV